MTSSFLVQTASNKPQGIFPPAMLQYFGMVTGTTDKWKTLEGWKNFPYVVAAR